MGNAACIFTVQERIGGPFVEITITVITNFKAMPACGCEDRVYYYLRSCTILLSAMHERPSQITSSIASNTTFSWEWKAVTLLSTYSSSQRELNTFSDFFFFSSSFWGIRFSFIASCRPSGVNSVLVGNVFVFLIAAPAWPHRSSSHHNKPLWIISLGQLILSGSAHCCHLLRQRQPKASELCAILLNWISWSWCSSCYWKVNG